MQTHHVLTKIQASVAESVVCVRADPELRIVSRPVRLGHHLYDAVAIGFQTEHCQVVGEPWELAPKVRTRLETSLEIHLILPNSNDYAAWDHYLQT